MNAQLQTQAKEHAKSLFMPAPSGLLQRKCACGNYTTARGECAECSKKKRWSLQTKLKVNEPGDMYEQEADRVADQVLATPVHPGVSDAPPRIQRFSGQTGAQTNAAPASVDQALAGPGSPLEPALRQDMEQRFGHDFSHVRVHTDERAVDSARAVNALAYTVGRHLVFGVGQYSPTTGPGRRLLAHELAHSVQQGFAANSGGAIHRKVVITTAEAPKIDLPSSEEVPERDVHVGFVGDALRNSIQTLMDKNVKIFGTYRSIISKAAPEEKRFALKQEPLLSRLRNQLDFVPFARCMELLGRKAPTNDELRKNSVVHEAIKEVWIASDPSVHEPVIHPHEEGGWVFMNLIDGSLSTARAPGGGGGNFIDLNDPPDVEGSVVVATFHTHPNMGPNWQAAADPQDKVNAETRGLPSLIAGNPGTNPDVFQVFLAGPAVRKHLASDTKLPGRSGGIAP